MNENYKEAQVCGFCLNPDSIISPETCCTGCSILKMNEENDPYFIYKIRTGSTFQEIFNFSDKDIEYFKDKDIVPELISESYEIIRNKDESDKQSDI